MGGKRNVIYLSHLQKTNLVCAMWREQSYVHFHDILYTSLAGHPLQLMSEG
jgi:hypothetical protein